jgi:hypothetical protein
MFPVAASYTDLQNLQITALYLFFLAFSILFTLLCFEAQDLTKKIVFGAFSMVLWFSCSIMNMGVAPPDSVVQAPVSVLYLALGLILLPIVVKATVDSWRLAYNKKYDVSEL